TPLPAWLSRRGRGLTGDRVRSVAPCCSRGASHVDRILRGAPPGDLPVELPSTFDLILNLRTARAMGLTIPEHVLLQATELIT
ncbi:MAG TPA: ABC transporter substrate binding protein, partial [Chloroflexota bacterium]